MIRRSRDYFYGKMDYLDIKNNFFYERFGNLVKTWNLFFKMKYLDFRMRMAEIAYSSYPIRSIDGIFHWTDWDTVKHLEDDSLLLENEFGLGCFYIFE